MNSTVKEMIVICTSVRPGRASHERIASKYLPILLILLTGAVLTACGTVAESLVLPPPEAPAAPSLAVENISIPGVPPEAIPLFANNCTACHGPAGEGSTIAPALNSAELRARLDDEAIAATITNGRPGTAMPAWGDQLTGEQINVLVALIRNWDSLDDEQLAQIAEQADDCGSMMGSWMEMHPGMGEGGHGPMMGAGCGSGTGGPWWWPFRP